MDWIRSRAILSIRAIPDENGLPGFAKALPEG